MNKRERIIVLQHVKERAEEYAFYREMGETPQTETALHACNMIECLADNLGISREEIESAANEGNALGERNARRRKANDAAWKTIAIYRDRETGETVSRAELEQEFERLKADDPETYDYSFPEYLRECTGKNGSLTLISERIL